MQAALAGLRESQYHGLQVVLTVLEGPLILAGSVGGMVGAVLVHLSLELFLRLFQLLLLQLPQLCLPGSLHFNISLGPQHHKRVLIHEDSRCSHCKDSMSSVRPKGEHRTVTTSKQLRLQKLKGATLQKAGSPQTNWCSKHTTWAYLDLLI